MAAHLQGMRHIALATVTRTGAPRVMPLDSFFFHGRFVWSTASYAVRITHLRRDPRCSAVHFEGDDLMVAVHGRCVLVESGDEFEALDQLCLDHYGSRATSWGSAITFGRIEPERMYAWAHHPENYPELDS